MSTPKKPKNVDVASAPEPAEIVETVILQRDVKMTSWTRFSKNYVSALRPLLGDTSPSDTNFLLDTIALATFDTDKNQLFPVTKNAVFLDFMAALPGLPLLTLDMAEEALGFLVANDLAILDGDTIMVPARFSEDPESVGFVAAIAA